MGSEAKRKSPLLLLDLLRLMPCSEFVSSTRALGMAAPLGSVTVPVIEAVSCAQAAQASRIKAAIGASFRIDFISCSPFYVKSPESGEACKDEQSFIKTYE